MENFTYHIPTKVYFGKGSIAKLGKAAKSLGTKALLVYGGGSIKRNGIYDVIVKQLQEAEIPFLELSGVEPNPRVTSVNKGVELMRAHGLDLLVAVGGGSAIDCAKGIGAGYYYDGDAWDLVMDNKLAKKCLPIIAIPTLAATGSEMDSISIISNMDLPLKKALSVPPIRPAVAIMDPEYTYTVSKYHTGAGTADIFSHVLEVYFNTAKSDFLSNRLCEAILKTCLQYGTRALIEPDNYEARSNLMWASSLAINGLLRCGKNAHAWSCHALEHVLSAYYDVTHGAGLAVITPYWMYHILSYRTVDKFVEYGVNVFGIDAALDKYEIANEAIHATQSWFASLGMPQTLRTLGIPDDKLFDAMAQDVVDPGGIGNGYVPLDKEDVLKIFQAAF